MDTAEYEIQEGLDGVRAGRIEGRNVDASDLARMMLRWEFNKRLLDDLEQEIKEGVMALGKTQSVGNVTASYSRGRRTYDYKSAGAAAPAETIELFTKHERRVDWRKVCNAAGLEVSYTTGEPSVSLKLSEKGKGHE